MAKKVFIDAPITSFSAQLWTQLQNDIQTTLQKTPGPWYAAFDADGTLWNLDMGEAFFDYQIGKLTGLPADPWAYYENLKKVDTPAAYLWLAQINAGLRVSDVLKMSQECLDQIHPFPLFESQKMLIDQLKGWGVEIFVVTASIQWAVAPAALRFYGITSDHVLGVQTQTDKAGCLTETQLGPMTWKSGKVDALVQRTKGIRPVFASGNTTGDLSLLDFSIGPKLAVCSGSTTGELKNSEVALQRHALQNGWLTHQF